MLWAISMSLSRTTTSRRSCNEPGKALNRLGVGPMADGTLCLDSVVTLMDMDA